MSCSAPSFTPLFGEQYDKLALSTAQQALLPEQFPLAPAAIFLSLILAALALVSLLLSSLAMHAPKKLAFLGGQRQIKLRNAALVTAIISAVGGLAACGSFHVDLGRAVNRWLEAGGKASLGTGLTRESFQERNSYRSLLTSARLSRILCCLRAGADQHLDAARRNVH